MKKYFEDTGWVFSRRQDICVFILLLGFFFAVQQIIFMAESANLNDAKNFIIFNILFLAFFDIPHALSSFQQVYKGEKKAEFSGLLFVPLILFTCLFGLFYWVPKIAFSIVAYLSIFHVLRQQYGWMRFSQTKSGHSLPPLQIRLDKLLIYSLTCLPLVMLHTGEELQKEDFGWLMPGDLFFFPHQVIYKTAIFLFWSILAVYIGFQLWNYKKSQLFPLGKLIIFLSTGLAWYGGICFNVHGEQAIYIDGLHAAPYLWLVFQVRPSKIQGKTWPAWFRYYAPLAVGGLLWAFFFYRYGFAPSSLVSAFVLGVLVTISTSHYIFDAFIWKIKVPSKTVAQFLAVDGAHKSA